jgi:hypothetical protein
MTFLYNHKGCFLKELFRKQKIVSFDKVFLDGSRGFVQHHQSTALPWYKWLYINISFGRFHSSIRIDLSLDAKDEKNRP